MVSKFTRFMWKYWIHSLIALIVVAAVLSFTLPFWPAFALVVLLALFYIGVCAWYDPFGVGW